MSSGLLVKPLFLLFLFFFSSLIPAGNEANVFVGGVCAAFVGLCPHFCTRYRPSGVQDQAPGGTLLLQVS